MKKPQVLPILSEDFLRLFEQVRLSGTPGSPHLCPAMDLAVARLAARDQEQRVCQLMSSRAN